MKFHRTTMAAPFAPLSPVFKRSRFLEPSTCRQIRGAFDRGDAESAEVLGDQASVRRDIRRVISVEVDEQTLSFVERALDAVRQDLQTFFGESLAGREGTGFLRYPPGGFYLPHRDRATVASWPDAARRRIAIVVFLNGALEVDPGGDFSGGYLRIYGSDTVEPEVSTDVAPAAGLLVAFRADAWHEVTTVVGGNRDVIVDWFTEAEGLPTASRYR